MIVGDVSKHTLYALQTHPAFKFYLTGSRFFGTNHAFSDWDFFAAETPELFTFMMMGLGFKRSHQGIVSYTGGVQPQIRVFASGDIHVQLIPPETVSEKLAAQQFLFDNGIIKDIAAKNSGVIERKMLNHSAWDTAVLVVRKAVMPASDPFFPKDGKQIQTSYPSFKPVETIPKPNRRMEW
jgi:hypothetical protein